MQKNGEALNISSNGSSITVENEDRIQMIRRQIKVIDKKDKMKHYAKSQAPNGILLVIMVCTS